MDVCREAVLLYGPEETAWMLIEEMGELMSSMNRRLRRGRVDKSTIEEELADVEICLEKMRHCHRADQVDEWKAIKLARLKKKILADRAGGMKNYYLLENKPVLEIAHETP